MLELLQPERLGKTLQVRVIPNASCNQIKPESQSDGTILWRVYVTTPPEDGKANQAVIKLLAKTLKQPKSAFSIIRGLTYRDKTITVDWQ